MGRLLATTCFALLALPGLAMETPLPVSPASPQGVAAVASSCPAFSWTALDGARGYELVVYRVEGGAPVGEPVMEESLPRGASSWTPSAETCLEPGGTYAWVVRALFGPQAGPWADAAVFQVAATPSMSEVEAAIAVLRLHLAATRKPEVPEGSGRDVSIPSDAGPSPDGSLRRHLARAETQDRLTLMLPSRRDVTMGSESAPIPGMASLTVSDQVHLDTDSDFFKGGSLFLWDDTTSGNLALGSSALMSAGATATGNTAIGHMALRSTVAGNYSVEGSSNTAVGDLALFANTTGFWNTANGASALASNTVGALNTAHGASSLYSNTEGHYNTAIGSSALLFNDTGSHNTAAGALSLHRNTSGDANTASGAFALRNNTTGSRNTATGAYALRGNFSGYGNTATGHFALYNNTASGNTAQGALALSANTTGFANTAVGGGALRFNTTGYRNTAIGSRALEETHIGSNNNIAIGWRAAKGILGDDNIIIANDTGGVTGQKVIQIGNQGLHTRTFIGGIWGETTARTDAVNVLISSQGELGTISSSLKVKQDIRDIDSALSHRLLDLRPVVFRYKEHAAIEPDTPLQFGLIAEEVAQVLPELVVFDDDGQPETVKYHLLTTLLLAELQQVNRDLEAVRRELDAMLRDVERGRSLSRGEWFPQRGATGRNDRRRP